jgi:beta-glucosidase
MKSGLLFPRGFLWGVATSAFQIEGGAEVDGRGPSVWDTFAAQPGKIEDASNARVTCDHYHRWIEDLDLLRWLGVGAYRFSIGWSRVLPDGHHVNEAGLTFYDRLVDGLLERGITPFVTLNHWDLPQALDEAGGWPERTTTTAFVEYADVVSARLGDRVKHWVTHNEPWCIAHLGHEAGEHAPGRRDAAASLRAAHHLLLSHGWAVEPIRRNARGAEVGIVLNLTPAVPATDDLADADAVRAFDGFFNRWYLDPLLRGSYPVDAIADRVRRGHLADGELPFVRHGDLASIATPIDFLGVNYYSRVVMRMDPQNGPVPVTPGAKVPVTDMGWELEPDHLRMLLVRLNEEYGAPKMYITENGAAYADAPDAHGRIADVRRIDFLRTHLHAIHRAIEAGVSVNGYFAWSLLDNFEWGHGFTKRFGLFWVDYETLQRLPKESAFVYRDLVAANALVDSESSSVPRKHV